MRAHLWKKAGAVTAAVLAILGIVAPARAHAAPVHVSGQTLTVQQIPAVSVARKGSVWAGNSDWVGLTDAGIFVYPIVTTLWVQARTGDSPGSTVFSVRADPKDCTPGVGMASGIRVDVSYRNAAGRSGRVRLVPCAMPDPLPYPVFRESWPQLRTHEAAATGVGTVTFTSQVFHSPTEIIDLARFPGNGRFTAR